MNTTIFHIAGFIASAAIIVVAGSRLSKFGDMIADIMGWGKMYIGLILMASVTSMPELITGVSSILIVDAPDLAVGDIVGSCAFNILIISIMDLFYNPKKPLTSMANPGNVLSATFSIIMLSVVALAILMPGVFGSVGWIGGSSFIFLLLYFVAIRVVFLYDRSHHVQHTLPFVAPFTLKQVVSRYILNAIIVILAAMALPFFGEHLAAASGLGQSFFGTLFLAASTSLPEIVVSVAAIRLGTIELAVGNIFGSNIFNIAILALDDIMHTKGPLLLYTSPNHVIPILGTVVITAIGISGIVFKSNRKWILALDTAFILLVYVLMMVLLYRQL